MPVGRTKTISDGVVFVSIASQLNPDGSMGVEASMKGVAKDVKILAKVRQAYLPDGCEKVLKKL